MDLKKILALANWAISLGWRDNFWATNEKRTHVVKKPKRLKNALREYARSSSSVRKDTKIRRILSKIIAEPMVCESMRILCVAP